MKIKNILGVLLLFVFAFGLAQTEKRKNPQSENTVFGKTYSKEEMEASGGVIKCATTEYEARLQAVYAGRANTDEFEAWLAPLIEKSKFDKSQSGGIITIPVVVHVIHSGQAVGIAPNITDAQVISQITAMNNDFRKAAGTRGFNSDPAGADTMIQFALAKVDPNGNPTNGIDRVNLCAASWSPEDVDTKVKTQTIWDPNTYLNMWTVNFSVSGLLGYAQFPSTSGLPGLPGNGGAANTDGVVASYDAFGSADFNDGTFILAPASNFGRTMTHEVGHYLGLRHLWGDGGCDVDDFVADTPNSSSGGNMHYFCNPNQDSCPSSPGLDMVRNYMNYTMDNCMNIFTTGQMARMMAVLQNSPRRSTLKTSVADQAIPLFANDAEIKIENLCGTDCGIITNQLKFTIYNRGTSTLTSASINYSYNGGASQVHNWTGSLTQDKFSTFTVNIPANTTLTSVNAAIQTVNGSADQRATNNSATKTYSQPINYQFSTVNFRLQCDVYGDETTWNLTNSSGTVLYSGGPYQDTYPTMPPLISETWNLAPNDCYVFTINDSYGDGINSGSGSGYFDLKSADGSVIIYSGGVFGSQDKVAFKIMTLATSEVQNEKFDVYPIPVTDILHVTKVSDRANYAIHNAAGQLVDSGLIKRNQINVSKLVTGNYIITVKDKEFNGSVKFIKK